MRQTLSILLISVVFASPAFAKTHDKDMADYKECQCREQKMEKYDMEKMNEMMNICLKHADKLGLTSEQVVKIKAIDRAMRKKVRFGADQKIAKIELMEIMEVKGYDLEKANERVQKILNIQRSNHIEVLKSMVEVLTILSGNQYKIMDEMIEGEKYKMNKDQDHQGHHRE